jgi:DNA repair exonuclease SbcCD ATPase subunit
MHNIVEMKTGGTPADHAAQIADYEYVTGAKVETDPPFDGPYVGDDTDQAAANDTGLTPVTETTTSRALAVVKGALVKFDAIELGIADLETRFANVVFDVSSAKGMAEAKAARLEIRQPRYNVQNAVTEAKKTLDAEKKAVAARGDSIIARIEPLEKPIHAQITAEEDRKAAEKAAKEQAEREARAKVDNQVAAINALVVACMNKSHAELCTAYDGLEALTVDIATFGDRAGEVEQVKGNVLEALERMRSHAKAIEEERAELVRQKAAQDKRDEDARQAEAERQAQIARDNAAQAERLAAMERRLQEKAAELEAQEAAARKAKQDREDAERAEAKRLADEKEAAERAERLRREEEERAERLRGEEANRIAREKVEAEAKAAAEEKERQAAEARRIQREEEERAAAADKKLRDAAPQLLAALQDMVMFIERDLAADVTCTPELNQARAAIALATK